MNLVLKRREVLIEILFSNIQVFRDKESKVLKMLNAKARFLLKFYHG